MKLTLKLTSRVRILALLPMLGLCLVLTGCEDLMVPQGMMVGSGTVTAVNAADRTVEIKTDRGDTLILSITDATKLQKPTYNPVLFGSDFKAMTFAEIEAGKYLEFTCDKDAVDGKHAATEAQMYKSKHAAENY